LRSSAAIALENATNGRILSGIGAIAPGTSIAHLVEKVPQNCKDIEWHWCDRARHFFRQ